MNDFRLYERLSGEELILAEKIQRRRLQVLIHACLYYEMNTNIIEDKQWDTWARELKSLQDSNPEIASMVCFSEAFKDFDPSTGFNLPIADPWVVDKATRLLHTHHADSQVASKVRRVVSTEPTGIKEAQPKKHRPLFQI